MKSGRYAIGFDIGSSSVKAALVDLESGKAIQVVQSPAQEMRIDSPHPDWAEQDPQTWWEHVCLASKKLIRQTGIQPGQVKSVGISYQMHGLVAVDREMHPVRPAIIWCDSRAIKAGQDISRKVGHGRCHAHLLNSPGNFTAAKLLWVRQHEPELFRRIHKIMLPGDYIALRFTGKVSSTIQGMSEGIFWDFKSNGIADFLIEANDLSPDLIPEIGQSISHQGEITAEAALETGLTEGTPVSYRAGDQPNNAMSLNVLHPGEIAATGGTSGVVYGVVDKLIADEADRVNSFAHVNHRADAPRIGVLLCINGTGSAYRFIRQLVSENTSYSDLEAMASRVPAGSAGLRAYPFGNGAERMLFNQNPGATFENIHFNIHDKAHFIRSTLEGIAFAFAHGIEMMQELGLSVHSMKAGNDNLFQSAIFSQTLANLISGEIQLLDTTGAIGAAKASAVGTGYFSTLEEAMGQQHVVRTFAPDANQQKHRSLFHTWSKHMHSN